MVFAFLIAALVGRISGGGERSWELLIKTHGAGVILQSVFMIPVVLTLDSLCRQHSPAVRRVAIAVGVAALSLVVLLVLLTFANVVWDAMYSGSLHAHSEIVGV